MSEGIGILDENNQLVYLNSSLKYIFNETNHLNSESFL